MNRRIGSPLLESSPLTWHQGVNISICIQFDGSGPHLHHHAVAQRLVAVDLPDLGAAVPEVELLDLLVDVELPEHRRRLCVLLVAMAAVKAAVHERGVVRVEPEEEKGLKAEHSKYESCKKIPVQVQRRLVEESVELTNKLAPWRRERSQKNS